MLNHPKLALLKKYHPILFDILLDTKFPFTHPKIICKTPVINCSYYDLSLMLIHI